MENKDLGRELLLKRLRDKREAMRGNRRPQSAVRPLENYSVVDTIKELLKDKKTMSVPRLNAKYIHLRQEHEPLYNMVVERDISEQELKLLENMINTRESMRDGSMSAELAKDNVATHAAEIFAPHLLRPTGSGPIEAPVLTPIVEDPDHVSDDEDTTVL